MFKQFSPLRDTVYDYASEKLIGEELFNAWLSESREPILFTCKHCQEAAFDLASESPMGEMPTCTSIEKLRQRVSLSSTSWLVHYEVCKSIYEIINGWVEPNNNRVIVNLLDS